MAFNFQQSTAFFRGEFIPFAEANVSIASSPVLYGLSIYTVFSVNRGTDGNLRIFRLRDHWQRLVNSAKIMDFADFAKDVPFERFSETMTELIKRNDIDEDVLVRVTIFIDELIAGTKIYGLKNSWSAYIYPMGRILSADGIHVCVSSWQRVSDNMAPARAKINGSYINNSLMKNEALRNGYDDAIAIDTNGHVAEGTVANIFIVRNGRLVTPDAATDILEGITRDSIIKLAGHLGIPVEQRTIDRSELYIADEALMVGSSARVTPILSIDKRLLGDGKLGPITAQITAAYADVQHGRMDDFAHWTNSPY